MSENLTRMASELAHEIFGEMPARVARISLGVMTHKFAVTLPNGERYVLRFYPPSREKVVEYEPDLLRRCHRAGIGAPEVMIDSRTGPNAQMHYVLYRMISGTPLISCLASLSSETLGRIADDVVHRVEALAQLSVVGHGDLVRADHARYSSLNEFIGHSFSEGLEIAERKNLWPDETIAILRKTAHNAVSQPLESRIAVLAWGDLSAENILIDSNNEVAGLVDFEGVIAADRLLNLGYACAQYHGSPFFDALVEAWPQPLQEHEWNWIHFYCVLRAVRLAPFAAEPLPTGRPRTAIMDLLPGFESAIKALSDK